MNLLTSLATLITSMNAAGDPFYCWVIPCP